MNIHACLDNASIRATTFPPTTQLSSVALQLQRSLTRKNVAFVGHALDNARKSGCRPRDTKVKLNLLFLLRFRPLINYEESLDTFLNEAHP